MQPRASRALSKELARKGRALGRGRRARAGRPTSRDPLSVAARLLAVRPRSARELFRRLREKGCAEAVAASVVRVLEERGLVDDREFARAVIESAVVRKPVGRRFLAAKLKRFEVPPEVGEEVLRELLPREREVALLRAAILGATARAAVGSRRGTESAVGFLQTRLPPGSPEKLRLLRALLARGFSADLVREVMDDLSSPVRAGA